MAGVTMDAGGLIAIDRGDRSAMVLVTRMLALQVPIVVPAVVLAQVWRDGRRQARLARFLISPEVSIELFDERRARAIGAVCGITRTSDVVDVAVVLGARERGDRIMTSDPDDLRRIDPKLQLIVV